MLSLPYFNKPFILENEALGVGVGVVLSLGGKPIAFLSQALSKMLRVNWCMRTAYDYCVGGTKMETLPFRGSFHGLERSEESKVLISASVVPLESQKWLVKL